MSSIDPDTFAQLRESTDAEFVAELVRTFLDDAPKLIATLRSSAAVADAAAFRRAAHTLKSNSTTFGALALAAMARDFENRGLDASPGIDALAQAFAQAAQELKARVHG